MLLPSADAVMVHAPAPVVAPLGEHGPEVEKVTANPEEDDALGENVPPYRTFGSCGKVIVCDIVLEP